VRAAFDDAARFHHQNLFGAANRRKTVRDHKRGAPAHQVTQSLLN